ncbi:MAG: polysaccharide deacetylase family protein, partial [bacterium]|nr:polysaccharide deacetylase family protein [bacterium]
GDYAEVLFARTLARRRRQGRPRRGPRYYQTPGLWLKYLLAYPFLLRRRERLIATERAPIIALFYHRVANDGANAATLPLEKFVRQVELIRHHYPIISLAEARRRLAEGRNGEIAFVITFDDGYAADLRTSIPYLQYFGIPATFFVSAGNIAFGRAFNHDAARGLDACPPMTPADLTRLGGCLTVGAHGLYHEDCGRAGPDELEAAIVGGKRRLAELTGREPEFFAFPKGIPGVNITEAAWRLAAAHFDIVASAAGGYNFPCAAGESDTKAALHLRRWGHPIEPVSLIHIMDGYTGLGDLLRGDLWGEKRVARPPWMP